jgi:uncharacterized protein
MAALGAASADAAGAAGNEPGPRDAAGVRAARFVALESYRKDASAVSTPMWFVERDGRILLRTSAATAKVKRIRANPRVRLAPCTVSGKIIGGWQAGRARLLTTEDAAAFNPALRRKYGIFKRMIDVLNRFRGITVVGIEVTLDE